MESKRVILPSEYVTKQNGKGTYKVSLPGENGTSLSFHVNVENESSVFLDRPQEGHLMMQEFWEKESQKVYCEVDSNGHLLVILPEGYDAFVNDEGHFILVKGKATVVTDGIGAMIIGTGTPQFTVR